MQNQQLLGTVAQTQGMTTVTIHARKTKRHTLTAMNNNSSHDQ